MFPCGVGKGGCCLRWDWREVDYEVRYQVDTQKDGTCCEPDAELSTCLLLLRIG